MHPVIAFLHTSPVHVPSFAAVLERLQPGTPAAHFVDEDLLRDARVQGHDHPDIVRRVQSAVRAAADSGARAVVCTCSTIGGAAETTPRTGRFVAMRIDRAMADRAVELGPRVLVVAALQSTLQPTADLVRSSARRLNRRVHIEELLAEDAWARFEAGDIPGYLGAVDSAVRSALPGPTVVVLAQASMANAGEWLQDIGVPVLSSPDLGVKAALSAVSGAFRPDC